MKAPDCIGRDLITVSVLSPHALISPMLAHTIAEEQAVMALLFALLCSPHAKYSSYKNKSPQILIRQ